jgi:serine/threonine protein kinase
MAPERVQQGPLDARADIYALTCVLYQSLTGQLPFPGDIEQIAAAHITQPPPQPSGVEPGVPEKLDTVVATGMAKDPHHRYATTVELASAAREAITAPVTAPPTSRHPSWPKREPAKASWWRRPGVAIAAGFLLTVIVARRAARVLGN